MIIGFGFGSMLGVMGYNFMTWQYWAMVGLLVLALTVSRI